jgi:hypothetical protein
MPTRSTTVAADGALPYRGAFGAARPPALLGLALPPQPMPSHQGSRPLKAWRYVGVFGPELMLCAAVVRVGRARQSFWAVWDRAGGRLYERTRTGRRTVVLAPGRLAVTEPGDGVEIDLELAETRGVETVARSGPSYAWTRKQGGIRARGTVAIPGSRRVLDVTAVIDDTAAYFERHTSWQWSAGVGSARDGRAVAWNLVDGVNDSPRGSERTVWVDGEPAEVGSVRFAPDLSAVGKLAFTAEATREQRQNLGLLRSRYRQPFGTFEGELLPGV